MLLVGCCIFLGAAQGGARMQPGRGGEGRFPLQPSLKWIRQDGMCSEAQLPGSSLASPGCIFCCRLSAADFVLHPVLSCTQRLLIAKLSSSKGRNNLLLHGSDMDRTAAAVKTTKLAAFQSPAKLPLSPTHPLTKHIIQDVHDKLWTNKHICSLPVQQGTCILHVSELPKRINVR